MKVKNIKHYLIKIGLENGNWHLREELIKDYFNNEIASNRQVYQIHLIPENAQSIEEVFFRLKSILNMTDKKIFLLRKKLPNKNLGIL